MPVKINLDPDNIPKKSAIKKKAPIKKIEKDAISLAPKKPEHKKIPEKPTPEIEYIIHQTTKFDLNWFYIKKSFIRFEKWLISPYTKYSHWWNKKFNTINIDKILTERKIIQNDVKERLKDPNEDLYEPIGRLEITLEQEKFLKNLLADRQREKELIVRSDK